MSHWPPYRAPMPDMGNSTSMANTVWAMQQTCERPLDKLLLMRIADGCGGSAIARFLMDDLSRFACASSEECAEALDSLAGHSLLQVVETGSEYTLAMPWWRPGAIRAPSSSPARKLQYKPSVRAALVEQQCARCWYCGCSLVGKDVPTPHVEHQIPLSRGGLDIIENLVAACGPCNQAKRDRTVEEYRDRLAARTGSAVRFHGEPGE